MKLLLVNKTALCILSKQLVNLQLTKRLCSHASITWILTSLVTMKIFSGEVHTASRRQRHDRDKMVVFTLRNIFTYSGMMIPTWAQSSTLRISCAAVLYVLFQLCVLPLDALPSLPLYAHRSGTWLCSDETHHYTELCLTSSLYSAVKQLTPLLHKNTNKRRQTGTNQ